MQKNLLGWLGWAGLDTVSRLALLTGSTAIFSRILSPHDFGITALVLIVVTVATVFVGTPFEEALAQRRVLRRRHIEAAMGAALAAGLILFALSFPLAYALAELYHEPDIKYLLPVGMGSIFFAGHSDVMTGLARRIHRFNDVSIATIIGNIIGIALSVVMVFLGFGLWALIAQRLLVVIVRAIVLQVRLRFFYWPRWAPVHLDRMGRFASLSLLDRLSDNLTFLAFNSLISAIYGVTVLGYVNMAMRIIEPVRGAVGATGHNFAFSFFALVQHDPKRLRDRTEIVMLRTGFVMAPIFLGIAAVTPVLLPLVSGPGWDEAISIAICLCIGSVIAHPVRLVFTALAAVGRPEYSLYANLAGFFATLLFLGLAAPLGPISVGLSRIVGDAAQSVIALIVTPQVLTLTWQERLKTLIPSWVIAGVMAIIVALVPQFLPTMPHFSLLVVSIGTGVILYTLGLLMFARKDALGLIDMVLPGRRAALTSVG